MYTNILVAFQNLVTFVLLSRDQYLGHIQCRNLLYQPTYLSAQVKLSQSLPPVYLTARNYHVSHVYPACTVLRGCSWVIYSQLLSYLHIWVIYTLLLSCFIFGGVIYTSCWSSLLARVIHTLLVLCFIVGVIYTILSITVWRYLSVKQSINKLGPVPFMWSALLCE